MEESDTAQAKEEAADSAKARDVGAPATLGSVIPTDLKKKGDLATYQGTSRDERP